MKKIAILLLAMAVFCIASPEANAVVVFHDGQTPHIDYEIDDDVRVAGGHVILVDGGLITGFAQLDYGYLNIAGGEVQGDVVSDSENCFITGGTIWGDIYSCDWNNNVSISGGTIHGVINAWDVASITIYGTDFNYDYGAIPALSGHLTGVLENGDAISADFLRSSSHSNIILAVPEPVLVVEIDIKPGSDPNPINQGSNGLVPVAILSSEDFDATQVDPTSVSLAGASVAVRGKGKSMANEEDVNGDGLVDLVVQVETQGFDDLGAGGTVELTGITFGGENIVGYDEVIIVPPDK